ncbi:hypothetical protein B0J12DRAFT_699871 [Macrophomina phaseolina]|uniref:Uncharacterized protein n=1 Tax=Macrophomina phaseolina TaxID=35725 RepID=A0ABQ8G9H6_9PEZI|nr:hypothetical protein B0J12DRAFT_699871 [Macrophomina phaseolina]
MWAVAGGEDSGLGWFREGEALGAHLTCPAGLSIAGYFLVVVNIWKLSSANTSRGLRRKRLHTYRLARCKPLYNRRPPKSKLLSAQPFLAASRQKGVQGTREENTGSTEAESVAIRGCFLVRLGPERVQIANGAGNDD